MKKPVDLAAVAAEKPLGRHGTGLAHLVVMKTNEIMLLDLDEVIPDPEQPRRHFEREAMARLKDAILAVGQLQPIRVRRVDDRWMIVDGQRRWLAMSALAKQCPEDERFQQIRAYVGGELDEGAASRRVVQVLSNIGEDLTPTERARALREITEAEPGLGMEELARRLGVPKGQVKFLKQLAGAPDFIQELGSGERGPPLPLWNLVNLVRLYRKLRRWDDDQFRDQEGEHERVADRVVRRLGDRAQQGEWGKRKLQQEADRILERITGNGGEEPQKPDQLAGIRRALGKVEQVSDTGLVELVGLLESALEKIRDRAPKRRSRRVGS